MIRIDVTNFDIIGDEPRGYIKKYWIEDGTKKLIKCNDTLYPDQDIMEKMAAEILRFLSIRCVNVSLGYNAIDNTSCCVVDSFLTKKGDVLYEVNRKWAPINTGNTINDIATSFARFFHKLSELYNISVEELQDMKIDYIRKVLGNCIIGNEDGKLKNINIIFNEEAQKYRLAPSFDNGLAFHAYSLLDTEPTCYVGNQNFLAKDVLEYIMRYYSQETNDIIVNLEELVDYNLDMIVESYIPYLDKKKAEYIINHIKSINDNIHQHKMEGARK